MLLPAIGICVLNGMHVRNRMSSFDIMVWVKNLYILYLFDSHCCDNCTQFS